jgi:hypothetical protein
VAVGAHDLAVGDLGAREASAAPSDEAGNVKPFRHAWEVVELHSCGMEPACTVCARLFLQLTHPRHQAVNTLSLQQQSTLARSSVIVGVVDPAAVLAPTLAPITSSMKLGFGFDGTA